MRYDHPAVALNRPPNRQPGLDNAQYLYDNSYMDIPSPMLGQMPSTPSLSATSASHRSSFSQPLGDQFNELADTCRDLQNQINELKSENSTMKASIDSMQDSLRRLGDKTTGTAESAKATKSIANQHKKAKVWNYLMRTSISHVTVSRTSFMLCSGPCAESIPTMQSDITN